LDILTDTELWLNWTKFFYPISGYEAKIDNPVQRYLITTFCYGCNLGTTQTARSLEDINRNQIAWVNQRHISEDKIDQAIRHLINSYNHFRLPKYWGTGKRASADGTKWDLYEQNLLSEYHIRYGGYGGIGYYHISDTYIALFSHFIPCGVWEAVYILDGLLKNESDIQPDIIHADTQGQNAPVFGLSFLLGINLMPRIRNWKDLKFYRAYKDVHYTHIDELFSDTIDWELIETHLPDMFRVALSIKAGRITPSTILRKLSTYSKKNRLYQAFRELGRVVRTGFLIKYMMDEGLRSIIQAATNKSEAFNGFAKWLSFGSEGIIAENDRDQQRKIIKYNHLVANCVIFYNVFYITKILQELIIEGYVIGEDIITALSPYIRQHVNRFGRYSLDLQRKPPSINYNASFTENVG
jgi:TnpA family transposase